jgi:AcrR family transcriptional regulator
MTTKEGAFKGGRPRSMQAQQAILDATLTFLATEGFDAMSIEAIAAAAGVGKQTIYRWWASKEALVIDAIKSLQQTHNPVVETGSLREDFLVMARNAFQTLSEPDTRGLVLNLLAMMTMYPHIYQAFYDQALAPRFQQLAHMIQRAQARGEVRQDLDANEIIGLLAGPFWYHLLFNAGNMPVVPDDLPERLVDAILQGIAGRVDEKLNQ